MKHLENQPQRPSHVSVSGSPASNRRDRLISRFFCRILAVAGLGFVIYLFVSGSFTSVVNRIKCRFQDYGWARDFDRDGCDGLTVNDGLVYPLTQGPDGDYGSAFKNSSKKVPLEAHIMSKCPDARDCLQQLVVPAMEQISDRVNFDLSFIASVSNESSEVICKHGPTECIGNILILCAINLPYHEKNGVSAHPRTPTIRSLGFANCLINSYERIPERQYVEGCAREHGIDFDALNHCASEQEDDPGDEYDDPPLSGIALLRRSALHSEGLGIATSCTVRLDESVWCVRDGGVWKDCAKGGQGSNVTVLVDEVKRLSKEKNH